MKRRTVLLAAVLASSLGTPQVQAQTAAELVAKVLSRQQTRGFIVRARLVTGEPGSERPAVVQVRTIGRRDGKTARLLCQALWPSSLKGRAVYVQKDGPQAVSGFVFQPPDSVTELSGDVLSMPLFDTDLTMEDLQEDFWSWPGPVAAGGDTVDGKPCRVVELRPPAGVRTAYTLVTTCISPERSLPLRIDAFGKNGAPARREEGDQGRQRRMGAGEGCDRNRRADTHHDARGIARRAGRERPARGVLNRDTQAPGRAPANPARFIPMSAAPRAPGSVSA